MIVIFCNDKDDIFSIHNVQSLEYGLDVTLNFNSRDYEGALNLLKPSNYNHNVAAQSIDVEQHTYGEYGQYSKGYAVAGRFYKYFEVHNE